MLSFEKKDPKKEAAKQKVEKEAKQAADDAIGAANACLRSDLFTKYRLDYERATKLIIEELIMLDKEETDPVRYGFQAKDIVSKLRHIGSLLRGVKQDAGQGV